MSAEISTSKAALRAAMRTRLRQMTDAERAVGSVHACALLAAQPLWRDAAKILCFAPLSGEPDVWPLVTGAIEAGKEVALPRFIPERQRYAACTIRNLSTDLQTGRFGIREPSDHCASVELNRLDLILVPGLAFDLHGHRLGRGKGFYDQLLAAVRGTTCGIAFDQQIVSEVPVEPHDARVNCILTPTRWIEL